MLYLTEISLLANTLTDFGLKYQPLAAEDLGYCVKTWLDPTNRRTVEEREQIASIRVYPWRMTQLHQGVKIVGWRQAAPRLDGIRNAKLGSRQVFFKPHQRIALSTKVVPERQFVPRRWDPPGSKKHIRDAAETMDNPNPTPRQRLAEYEKWTAERLEGALAGTLFGAIDSVEIRDYEKQEVVRKIRFRKESTSYAKRIIPIANAVVRLTVRSPEALEAWLLRGTNPHRCFGYGAWLPVR